MPTTLTATEVKNLKGNGKRRKISDAHGLYLQIEPKGSKYWRMAYRFHGLQRTLSIGTFPTVSLADAREGRDAARKLLARGIDPSQDKRRRRREAAEAHADTFRAVALEWLAAWGRGKAPKNVKQTLRRMEVNIFPAIGNRPIGELGAPEILPALRKIEARDAMATAYLMRQAIGKVFRFAMAAGKVKGDPTPGLKGALGKYSAAHHKPMPRGELPRFLRAVDAYDGRRPTALALKLIVLTMLRSGEVRGGKWAEIEGDLWRIPAARMKKRREHLIPLPVEAVEIFKELKTLSMGSEFIFPSGSKSGIMSENTLLGALYRMGFHGVATVHGFRGLASTILHENGFNSDWIELQLAHADDNRVRAAYNSAIYLPERRKMLEWWADYLMRQNVAFHRN